MGLTLVDERAAIDADAPEIEALARDAIAASALFGAANVVMQLAMLPVGRGVAESEVDHGRVDLHPFKRQRTTAQYLIVALLGDEHERRAMRKEVNRSHKGVVRKPGESDVTYNAFDSKLQLWVAGCIYVGFSVWVEFARGPLDDATHEAFYQRCSRIATTLQVPEDKWPATRAEFYDWWWEAMDSLEMDDVSRTYLQDLIHLRIHKGDGLQMRWFRLIARVLRKGNSFMALGFLAPQFREMLHETWSPNAQRKFETFLRRAIWVDQHAPRVVRHALLDAYEWDVKRRIRKGKAIV